MTPEIKRLEDEIRAKAVKLRDIYDGYPSTNVQFDYFKQQIHELDSLLELRNGKIWIEKTS